MTNLEIITFILYPILILRHFYQMYKKDEIIKEQKDIIRDQNYVIENKSKVISLLEKRCSSKEDFIQNTEENIEQQSRSASLSHIDDILDKINDKGINSLSNDEIEYLKNFKK